MFMITDSEFVAEMVRKIAIRYKSKRQFALEIGEKTGQNLNHWIKRGRVPGDKNPWSQKNYQSTGWITIQELTNS